MEHSLGKESGSLVDKKLNTIQQCACAAASANCRLVCISKSIASGSRRATIPFSSSLLKQHFKLSARF